MMTFEEFLTKKKIDQAQFKTAQPGLFYEFQSHYSQMGEKSFDHSKKFLFNKLRRAYHLKEPAAASQVVEVNEIASQAEPLLSPTLEATVYTPRFRAGGTAKAQEAEHEKMKYPPGAEESTKADPAKETNDASAKPAFKPRFKPGLTGGSQEAKSIEETKEEIPADKPKPVYVPRFKPPAPVKPAEEEPKQQENTPDKAKPAYIPRFKAKPSPPSDL
jgi:hypothetical protein